MRSLIAGLVCLIIGIGLTEYQRRHPTVSEAKTEDGSPKKKTTRLSSEMEALIALDAPGTEGREVSAELQALLAAPGGPELHGFSEVTTGKFNARELHGGFGAALFIIDANGSSAVVRASAGDPATVIASRKGRIDALGVDGSTVFFSSNGALIQTFARGDEAPVVRARFKNATVTSIAAAGDTLIVTLVPKSDPDEEGAVVAVQSDGTLVVIAKKQQNPRGAQTDGKDAYWVAGESAGLWRGALDGAFSSQLTEPADVPLALDGDAVYYRAPMGTGTELRKVGRAGGKQATLITAEVGALAVSSGLIRIATTGAGAGLLELTSGTEASKVMDLPGSVRGLAIGGTQLFLLTQNDDGTTVLRSK